MTKITLEQVKQLGNGKIITYSGEEALYQVKQDGYALKYVHNQTPKICLEAVKKYGDALRYVHNQTPKICLEAVKQNGLALRYVDERCFESDTKRL